MSDLKAIEYNHVDVDIKDRVFSIHGLNINLFKE